ncbi:MAG: hypothetical protein KF789_12550 [Bdellovibrionaceae bacterium]|nr:hypothetical protein [Pseudobdellovibrionaceae bacterium]
MTRGPRVLLSFLVALVALPAFAGKASLDFWEKSPVLWKEFRDERKIFVSAKEVDGRTESLGAGLVDAPLQKVWAFANDPEKIKKTTALLEDFKWDRESGKVELHLKLLTFRYLIKGIATPKPDPENPKIEFRVLEGDIVPFTAELELRSAKAQALRDGAPAFPEGKTLVRIFGQSSPDRSLSWPLRVALEAVLQRVAGTLRQAVESESTSP